MTTETPTTSSFDLPGGSYSPEHSQPRAVCTEQGIEQVNAHGCGWGFSRSSSEAPYTLHLRTCHACHLKGITFPHP